MILPNSEIILKLKFEFRIYGKFDKDLFCKKLIKEFSESCPLIENVDNLHIISSEVLNEHDSPRKIYV